MENVPEVANPNPDYKPAVFEDKNPRAVVERATEVANLLTPIVDKARLFEMISGKKYVKVEGWTTMLAMLGILPHIEYCHKLEREGEIAYESRTVLKTLDGRVVGSGEAICSNAEPIRRNWTESAIKSMCQTRSTGKAARAGFSWIMAMAGYEGTPADEMMDAFPQGAPKPTAPHGSAARTPATPVSKPSGGEWTTITPKKIMEKVSKRGTPFWSILDATSENWYRTFSKTDRAAIKEGTSVRVRIEETSYGPNIAEVFGVNNTPESEGGVHPAEIVEPDERPF